METLTLPFTETRPAARVESFDEVLAARALDFDLPAPHPRMRACIVVPARNEEAALPALIAALAGQRGHDGAPLDPRVFEIVLLLNNCTDRTAGVTRDLQNKNPALALHVAEISFAADEAHVGRARQALFDLASTRLRDAGLILTTDADSRPAPDWIAQNESEIARGVDGVGGRIVLDPAEAAALPPGVRRLLLLDIGYRRALEEMRALYSPEGHDPFPRHHQHFGGSLAVTAAAYAAAGGMPLRRSSEDVALYRAIVDAGGRFRHSHRVRVITSARMIGRARGGLADALEWWNAQALSGAPVIVESATAAERRLARLGLWNAAHTGAPPLALTATPEPPRTDAADEIHATLRILRERIATLRPLSHAARLDRARHFSVPAA